MSLLATAWLNGIDPPATVARRPVTRTAALPRESLRLREGQRSELMSQYEFAGRLRKPDRSSSLF